MNFRAVIVACSRVDVSRVVAGSVVVAVAGSRVVACSRDVVVAGSREL